MKTFDSDWSHIHEQRAWGKYPAEEVIRFVCRNYKINRHETRLLDLGCGAGANTWFLAREGFNTLAFDGAFAAVSKARDLCNQSGVEAGIFQADAGILPIKSNSIDGVIDSATITSNSRNGVKAILNEVYRVLKPGGKIFSTSLFTRAMTGYGTGQQVDQHSFRNMTEGPLTNIGTVHFFTKSEIQSLWHSAGFKNLCIDRSLRTDCNSSIKISYYLVSATKPGKKN